MDVLPGDMLRTVSLDLPLDDLTELCMSSKTMMREVCNHNDFWKRRYTYDYGRSDIIDVGKTWKDKYRFRHDMNRVWEIGEANRTDSPPIIPNDIIYAKQVCSIGSRYLAMVNLDGTVTIFGSRGSVTQYDVSAIKVVAIDSIASDGAFLYILTEENRIMYGPLFHTLQDIGISDIIDIYPHTVDVETLVMIDTDNYLLHLDEYMMVSNTGLKVKDYAYGAGIVAIIDMSDNVWYTDDVNSYPEHMQWTHIPGIKGKSVEAGMGVIITDLENNLWGFGNNEYGNLGIGDLDSTSTPIKLSITGRDVFMNIVCTIVVDMDYNVWYFGSQMADEDYLESLIGPEDLKRIVPLPGHRDIEMISEPVKVPRFKGLGANVNADYMYLIGNFY